MREREKRWQRASGKAGAGSKRRWQQAVITAWRSQRRRVGWCRQRKRTSCVGGLTAASCLWRRRARGGGGGGSGGGGGGCGVLVALPLRLADGEELHVKPSGRWGRIVFSPPGVGENGVTSPPGGGELSNRHAAATIATAAAATAAVSPPRPPQTTRRREATAAAGPLPPPAPPHAARHPCAAAYGSDI